ncbi:hypothetical protein AVEN_255747-1 [Araneus ventricosus]|uniref:Uncharacterized protein n=1 Tax=Araneus ventricosus TaxID=182803 RepID=A0A4Y2UAX6_ARAVE|nr:hypothetical protein AVEN_51151-1 [Araneus ventricosus]GBO08786.1 hypothetical protein AVEN_255747-1 [Araneus ventricosus]
MVLVLLNELPYSSDEIQITVYLDDNTEHYTNTEYGQNSKIGIIVATFRGQQRHRQKDTSGNRNKRWDSGLTRRRFPKSPSSLRVRNSTDSKQSPTLGGGERPPLANTC